MENDETNNEEVVDEKKDEPEEVVRGSLLSALGVISPDEVKKIEDEDEAIVADVVAEVPEVTPAPDANDVLPDDIVDAPVVPEPDPDPIKISAKDIRVKRRPKAAEPVTVEPTPEPEPEPEPEPVVADLSHLSKRERDTLALVQFGEESGVADGGVADKVLKYYEDRKALIKKLQDENIDDEDYDMSQDRELDRWKKRNPPPIDADSLDDIRQERTIKIAEDRAVKRMESKNNETRQELDDYKRNVEAEKRRPTVDGKVSQFSDELLSAMPEEVTSVVSKEADWAKVEEALPVEAPIVKRVLNKYADQVEVFLSVVNGVSPQNGADPIQSEVRQFMFEQADILLAKGNTLRGGKQFVHPARFVNAEADRTWTFSSDQVVQMLQAKAQKVAKREISFEQKRIDSIISRRGGKAPAPKGAGDEAHRSTSVGSSPAGDSSDGTPAASSGLLGALGL